MPAAGSQINVGSGSALTKASTRQAGVGYNSLPRASFECRPVWVFLLGSLTSTTLRLPRLGRSWSRVDVGSQDVTRDARKRLDREDVSRRYASPPADRLPGQIERAGEISDRRYRLAAQLTFVQRPQQGLIAWVRVHLQRPLVDHVRRFHAGRPILSTVNISLTVYGLLPVVASRCQI